jgi:hypothetical protein
MVFGSRRKAAREHGQQPDPPPSGGPGIGPLRGGCFHRPVGGLSAVGDPIPPGVLRRLGGNFGGVTSADA